MGLRLSSAGRLANQAAAASSSPWPSSIARSNRSSVTGAEPELEPAASAIASARRTSFAADAERERGREVAAQDLLALHVGVAASPSAGPGSRRGTALGSMPFASASANVSARFSTRFMIQRLTVSFSRVPAPGLVGEPHHPARDRVEDLLGPVGARGAGRAARRSRPAASSPSTGASRKRGVPRGEARRCRRRRRSTSGSRASSGSSSGTVAVDGGAVGEHRDHDLGAVDRLRGRVRHGCAEPLGLLARPVPDGDVVPGSGEVAGHRPAHDPGAEEGDAHQVRGHVPLR